MKPLIPPARLLIQSPRSSRFSVMCQGVWHARWSVAAQPVAVVRKEGWRLIILQSSRWLIWDAGMRAALDRKTVLDKLEGTFSSTCRWDQTEHPGVFGFRIELVRIIAQRLVEAGVVPQRILIWDRFEREFEGGFLPAIFMGWIVVATVTACT